MSKDPYRALARIYDAIFEPMNRGLRRLGLRICPAKESDRVLDVGCGTGLHLELYGRSACELHGLDRSPSMLDIAKKRLGGKADLRLGDATRMPYDAGSFDLILCMLALHEMDPPVRKAVLAEMKRVVADTGRILVIDFHAGGVSTLKGRFTQTVIFLSEIIAGWRHFRNYRQFLSIGGLPPLFEECGLSEVERKVVAGGNLALHVVRPG